MPAAQALDIIGIRIHAGAHGLACGRHRSSVPIRSGGPTRNEPRERSAACATRARRESSRASFDVMSVGKQMDPLELARLPRVMALTSGRADVVVGLVDGPVALDHPAFATGNILVLDGGTIRRDAGSISSQHGTCVAGILSARRESEAPGIAPDCTLVIRPVFTDVTPVGQLPSASPRELAEAIVACVNAGVRVINLSAALEGGSFSADRDLAEVMDFAARRGVLMVAAAGNHGAVAGSAIIGHRWTIPVVACDRVGRPLAQSNLGRSIGIGGLGGPGEDVVSLEPLGKSTAFSGTSVAAPFVTAAAALLWSLFPKATAAEVKCALLSPTLGRRRTVVPPLLDAWGAYEVMAADHANRAAS